MSNSVFSVSIQRSQLEIKPSDGKESLRRVAGPLRPLLRASQQFAAAKCMPKCFTLVKINLPNCVTYATPENHLRYDECWYTARKDYNGNGLFANYLKNYNIVALLYPYLKDDPFDMFSFRFEDSPNLFRVYVTMRWCHEEYRQLTVLPEIFVSAPMRITEQLIVDLYTPEVPVVIGDWIFYSILGSQQDWTEEPKCEFPAPFGTKATVDYWTYQMHRAQELIRRTTDKINTLHRMEQVVF